MPPPLTWPLSPQTLATTWSKDTLKPALEKAAGKDGKLSATEAARAGGEVKDVYDANAMKTPAVSTLTRKGEALLLEAARAAAGADGLLSAAESVGVGQKFSIDFNKLVSAEQPLQFSESVLASVMTKFGISDRSKLLDEAAKLDNGNGYLNRTELESAAKALKTTVTAVEPGVISDIDQTIIPKYEGADMPAPFPGIAALFRALEGATKGDIHLVTARSPDRITEMPAYFKEHNMPLGTIDTGTSAMPWVAQAEKVKDITAQFEAHPNQKFVLFGDATHVDPEVYKAIKAKYPDRVLGAFILDTKKIAPARTEGLSVVKNYAEAASILFKNGTIDKAAARGVMLSARSEGLAITDTQISALLG